MLEVDVAVADGRVLHAYDVGPTGRADELVLLWHGGTPNTGAPPEPLFDVADCVDEAIGFIPRGTQNVKREPLRTFCTDARETLQLIDEASEGFRVGHQ